MLIWITFSDYHVNDVFPYDPALNPRKIPFLSFLFPIICQNLIIEVHRVCFSRSESMNPISIRNLSCENDD